MQIRLFACAGGTVCLPAAGAALSSREDGGNLIVTPPRDVWERGELTPAELRDWGCLVAASGAAMLSALPQLDGGCVNYWEAGNWALHPLAPPEGAKTAPLHRSVHLHLIGRSVNAKNPDWRWGEAPLFPRYEDRIAWAAAHERLTPGEARAVAAAIRPVLLVKYEFAPEAIAPYFICASCSYPAACDGNDAVSLCQECRS